MKLCSFVESRTENLGVAIRLSDFKRIMDRGERKFHFKWLADNNFVISLNFSFGSNLIFDVTRPNTKSDVIFYGRVTEIEESKIKIKLKTRSRYFLTTLIMVFPLLVLSFQIILGVDFPVFIFALVFFPLIIIGLLSFIRSEEESLLRKFKQYLSNEIIKLYN